MVARKARRIQTKKPRSILSLPSEIFEEILRHAASNSVTDFVNVSLTCKDFLEASKYDYIFETVSMEKHRFVPWFRREEVFLERCKNAKNPEALYRQGMIYCFHIRKPYSGLRYLEKAIEKGHVEAMYAYGIILICWGGELKDEGLKVVSALNLTSPSKRSLIIPRCRYKAKELVSRRWFSLTLSRPKESVNNARVGCKYCKDIKMCPWELALNYLIPTGCDSCFWDREVNWFINMLGIK